MQSARPLTTGFVFELTNIFPLRTQCIRPQLLNIRRMSSLYVLYTRRVILDALCIPRFSSLLVITPNSSEWLCTGLEGHLSRFATRDTRALVFVTWNAEISEISSRK